MSVSVVIPTSRGGPYLREAVASVVTQGFESSDDCEIVIVSDGCDEDMSDLEANPLVRVVRQRRRGASIARNVGVAHARHDLIALLDDDDRMVGPRLPVQIGVMEDADVVLCHTQFRFIDADGKVLRDGGARDNQYEDLLRVDGGALLSTIMVRRSTFHEVGGINPLLPIGEDLDFIMRVAREGRLQFVPEILTEYRLHANNTWAKSSASSGVEIKLILQQHQLIGQARDEAATLKAARSGVRHVLPGRTQWALERAEDAVTERKYGRAVLSMGSALLRSPVATTGVTYRRLRRGTH
jgi:glycosyltransferase involved in cell wall biosynthesis